MPPRIVRAPATADPALCTALADLTLDCIRGGASVGWLDDVQESELAAWWAEFLTDPATITWYCVPPRDDGLPDDGLPDDGSTDDRLPEGGAIGTVSLRLEAPTTGRHRAEITKLLVCRRWRRHGVATALMTTAQEEAHRRGRTLLLLDTEAGSPAEDFYGRLGWVEYGRLADHAARPEGSLSPTVFLALRLPDRR